jgi:ATP-dependent DNA helicase RecG
LAATHASQSSLRTGPSCSSAMKTSQGLALVPARPAPDKAPRWQQVMFEIYSDRVVFSNPGTPIVEPNRFIDGYQSRNERLADLMRRMSICEEKGSGIDKVIHAAEVFQLPAPQFREEHRRTSVVLAGPKPFDDMDRDERIRACYQHAGLKRVTNDFMTDQTLRDRFKLPDSKGATVSQIITATVDAGLVKADESVGASLKLRRYLPYWA